nr:hypothetical protein [Tanacetum cinerariifolium]
FTKVKNASTPMETQKPLLKDKDGEEVNVHMYRLISWQCKKQIVVANSTTESEYVAALSYHGQVLWIQNQLLDYGDCNEKKLIQMVKIYTDKNVADFLTKSFDSTAMAKTINEEAQIHARVDGKKIIITEASIRRHLKLADEEGVDCLPNSTIFEQLALMGCQEAIRDTTALTRFESVSKHSNDSLLARGNTLRNDEDRVKLNELIELCTNLQTIVLDLEKTKTTQSNEIASLKRRVKKLEKKNRSRTHKLKILYKVGLTARVESFGDEESLGEGGSKQERIEAIDVDEDITLVNVQDDADMFDVNDLGGEEVFVIEQEIVKDQKVDDDKEKIELKHLMETIPGEEEVAIDAIPLAVKSPRIVDWKIYKEGKKSYYQIIRADGRSQMYMFFSQMLKIFDKEDLEDLYKLIKARYGSTRPVDNIDYLLWSDMKLMFKPHVYDEIYMLVEKKYPLTPPTLLMMLERKLQMDYERKIAYQLCKLIKKQLKNQRSVWKHPLGVN